MFRDRIVEEIRRIREAHAARFDFDIRRIVADLKTREGADGRQVLPAPLRPPQSRPAAK
ncbi:MAG: hypothetical protein WD872_13000 [Pirellulaceae bacterium]